MRWRCASRVKGRTQPLLLATSKSFDQRWYTGTRSRRTGPRATRSPSTTKPGCSSTSTTSESAMSPSRATGRAELSRTAVRTRAPTTQGESRMLDSPERVCAGQVEFEYPATSVPSSNSSAPPWTPHRQPDRRCQLQDRAGGPYPAPYQRYSTRPYLTNRTYQENAEALGAQHSPPANPGRFTDHPQTRYAKARRNRTTGRDSRLSTLWKDPGRFRLLPAPAS